MLVHCAAPADAVLSRTALKVAHTLSGVAAEPVVPAALCLPSFYHVVVMNHPYSFGSEPVSKGMNSSNDEMVRVRTFMFALFYSKRNLD